MQVMRRLWNTEGMWGPYGFYDAYNPSRERPVIDHYLAIDQGPIAVMIENYRSGLLWDLFMASPEIRPGLEKLGFCYKDNDKL